MTFDDLLNRNLSKNTQNFFNKSWNDDSRTGGFKIWMPSIFRVPVKHENWKQKVLQTNPLSKFVQNQKTKKSKAFKTLLIVVWVKIEGNSHQWIWHCWYKIIRRILVLSLPWLFIIIETMECNKSHFQPNITNNFLIIAFLWLIFRHQNHVSSSFQDYNILFKYLYI